MWLLLVLGCGRVALEGPVEPPEQWAQVRDLAALSECGSSLRRFETRQALEQWHQADAAAVEGLDFATVLRVLGGEPLTKEQVPAAQHAAVALGRCGGLVANATSVSLELQLCEEHGEAWLASVGDTLVLPPPQAIVAREAVDLFTLAQEFEREGQGLSKAQIEEVGADLQAWVLDPGLANELVAPRGLSGLEGPVVAQLLSAYDKPITDLNRARADLHACHQAALSGKQDPSNVE